VGNTTVLTRNEEAQLGAIIHLGSAVKRAQQQLQADDGAEPSLDEVGILHSSTLNDVRPYWHEAAI
jgi:hypothetical protein